MEVGDQPCVFTHGPENERLNIVTRTTPVFVYHTHHLHTVSYRIVWLEYSLFVLACVPKSLSFEKWTSYLPDTQVEDTKHEERRTCECQTKPITNSDWTQGECWGLRPQTSRETGSYRGGSLDRTESVPKCSRERRARVGLRQASRWDKAVCS